MTKVLIGNGSELLNIVDGCRLMLDNSNPLIINVIKKYEPNSILFGTALVIYTKFFGFRRETLIEQVLNGKCSDADIEFNRFLVGNDKFKLVVARTKEFVEKHRVFHQENGIDLSPISLFTMHKGNKTNQDALNGYHNFSSSGIEFDQCAICLKVDL